MRTSALLAAAALLGLPSSAAASERASVSIPGQHFAPAQLTAVVGDEVTWRNTDLQDHDVRALDGSFDSGRLGRLGSFTLRLDRAGPRPYLCAIHPFMRGRIDVVGALLQRSEGPVLAGEPLRLGGRAAPGAVVRLERRIDDGAWHAEPGWVVAAADGSFAFSVVAAAGAGYRAVTAAGASLEVAPAVTAHLDTRLVVRPGRHHALVRVLSTPAPGLVAVLQRYSRERYMWRSIDHARLDRAGRAAFHVRRPRRGRLRALLSRGVRGEPLAVTGAVRLRDGSQVRDPAAPLPAGPGRGHH